MNIDFLEHVFRVGASWRLKKMLKMFTFTFKAGITGDRLLGPYSLPSLLTGTVYHDYLRNVLPELLQHLYLQSRIHSQFTHHNAEPNFLPAVRYFLNNAIPKQRMGRGWPQAWSAGASDLNRLLFINGDI
jgi:hypothetical protein